MNKPLTLEHCYLVAAPSLTDPSFKQSVIYLYEHTEEGSSGLIINKPLELKLGNVLQHLDIPTRSAKAKSHGVLMGGPVSQDNGFILQPQRRSAGNVTVSSSRETLLDIAEGKGPKDFIITLGYSGWEAGQLEREIVDNSWIITPFCQDILFDVPAEKRWEEAASLIGLNIHQVSHLVGHA